MAIGSSNSRVGICHEKESPALMAKSSTPSPVEMLPFTGFFCIIELRLQICDYQCRCNDAWECGATIIVFVELFSQTIPPLGNTLKSFFFRLFKSSEVPTLAALFVNPVCFILDFYPMTFIIISEFVQPRKEALLQRTFHSLNLKEFTPGV